MTYFDDDVSSSDSLHFESFRLAQYVREDRKLEGDIYRAIRVWDVTFVLEEQNITGLHATCLKAVLVDPDLEDWHISLFLRDQHLAFSVSPVDERGHELSLQYICIVEWQSVEDRSLDYPRTIIRTYLDSYEIHILPNNRISAWLSPSLLVYDYSTLRYTDHMPAAHPGYLHLHLTPSSECSFVSCNLHTPISAPFDAQGVVQFLVVARDSAQSVVIPDDFGTH
ncbi:hypothetical protein D9613_000048 [Agrocybe pediades]|uniref:Uncharacterized protein n=1 Tax=Agrocybe pediades TaxID=84607 RepID=A0A8H4R224_9AGAR|nr:hypothetical protein D9613_000048 [Agrocybe pediades]